MTKFLVFGLTLLAAGAANTVAAADFFCGSGNVTCLIAAINTANQELGEHTITLEPGIYTLQIADNEIDGPNGLPSITRSILIRASSENAPTVIERDPGAPDLRLFHVAASGQLTLDGVTLQRGGGSDATGSAVLNRGITTLQDCIVTNNLADEATIMNVGTLNVLRSIISNNIGVHSAGGIVNQLDGKVLLDNSTISHNGSNGTGGLFNEGVLLIKNSVLLANGGDSGGGLYNSGSATVVNTTIAKNIGGFGDGQGIWNTGQLSVTNSTVRENQGGGIIIEGGTVEIRNTIVAGNGFDQPENTIVAGNNFDQPDCLGVITSLGNNLIGDTSGCIINFQPSDLTGDPGLDMLVGAGEGDPPGTAHYPVLPGSVVIDTGNAAACPKTDQLGNHRNGTCDIGAIEFRPPSVVNNLVFFAPLNSTFKTTSSTVGCPAGFVGTFSFNARLSHKTKSRPLADLILRVRTLTNGNLLKNAVDGPGGVGATATVAKAGLFSDGILNPREFVDQTLAICLKNKNRFSFFVDVLGHPSG